MTLVRSKVINLKMTRCESWTVKKAKCRRMDAFELWCWRRLLRVPCSPRDSQSLLQHRNLKASVFQCSAFFMVQLLHPYMPIGKTIALTTWTFVSKVMSMLFNMLSRFIMGFSTVSDCKISACNSGDSGSTPGRRYSRVGNDNPPVFLPGDFYGQRRLTGCSPQAAKSRT